MLTIRARADRGHSDLGWLDSFQTFSFGGYSDPRHMGFRALRVLNEDRIAPGKGFGAHGHRDMEILSYVLKGRLSHNDSVGSRHAIGPNEVQIMSAGTGVIHSEFNGSPTDWVHFLQIWITPAQPNVEPSYQQIAYAPEEKRGRLRLMAGPKTQEIPGAATLNQDVRLYGAVLGEGEQLAHRLPEGRHGWVQCASGHILVNGMALEAGDGLAISDEPLLTLQGAGPTNSELLLFDLA